MLHMWADNCCRNIVARTAAAMKPEHSRVLIEDLVLPACGAGLRPSAVDVLMYRIGGGIERTIAQWEDLIDSAGLRVVQTRPDEGGAEPIIEGELKVS